MEIRQTTLADVALLAQFRAAQLVDEGQPYNDEAPPKMEAYFAAEMGAGHVRGWFAVENGEPVAVCSVSLFPWPPSFTYMQGNYGYVQSVYTKPACRGRGYASALVKTALAWLEEQGVTRTFLGASDQGRPVYEQLGFTQAEHFMMKQD